jgi:NADPH:quinone reductase-like Zn-dependent oxidoreductase
MKAARYSQFGGPEVFEIVDLPDPRPGPGQIRVEVRAAGINQTDWKVRQGLLGGDLPLRTGSEVAGIVDEIGDGVTDVEVGDRVFGIADEGTGGAAELVLVAYYAPMPPSLDFAEAGVLPVPLEVATRGLDALGVEAGSTVLINGAAGGIGSAAVQIAVARGARVIGIDSPARLDYLRSLDAEAIVYGDGLVERVRELAPDGVDLALDVAGSGVIPELIELTGSPERVVTLADFKGAEENGVKFSRGEEGRAVHSLAEIGELIEAGRFSLPVAEAFPLNEIAEAHRVAESGHAPGKLVLLVG